MGPSHASENKRPNKRRELGDKSKGDILDAALAAMSTFGYEGTSVARIASESGLPASSIYWHFGSKAGVLAAVMERGASEFFAEYESNFRLEGDVSDPLSVLVMAFEAGQKAVANHPEFLRLMFLLGLSGEHDERVAAVVRQTADRGHVQLHALIRFAFSGYGDKVALSVADHLVDVAQANFDGAFLSTQIRSGVDHAQLARALGETIYRLGIALVDRSE